jgi:hypothetical protein
MYWLCKRGPNDLRTQLGKREEKRSLETRDPAEAKQRLAAVLAELDKRWANLRADPRAPTGREAHEIAVRAHDAHLARSLKTHFNIAVVLLLVLLLFPSGLPGGRSQE